MNKSISTSGLNVVPLSNKSSVVDKSKTTPTDPLTKIYLILKQRIDDLHSCRMLTYIKNKLNGYSDCITLGENKDLTPPLSYNVTNFYQWKNWKDASLEIALLQQQGENLENKELIYGLAKLIDSNKHLNQQQKIFKTLALYLYIRTSTLYLNQLVKTC